MTNVAKPHSTAEAHDLLMEAFEAIDEGMAVFDDNRCLVQFNTRYAEMLEPVADLLKPGLAWEDLLQEGTRRGFYADPNGQQREWLANVAIAAHTDEEPVVISIANGDVHRVGYNPTRSGGFVVTRSDITDEFKAEARIREREELLSLILDTNPASVVMARLSDGLIIYRSPAARDVYGDTTHAGQHYVSNEDRAKYIAEMRKTRRVDDYRVKFRHRDGHTFEGSVAGRMTEYNGQTYVVSTILDLSERSERDAMIRKVVESCPAPILMTRAASGEILFKSPEIDALFGPTMSTRDFYVVSADRKGFLDALRKNGSVHDFRARVRNAKGEPFLAAVSARLIEYNGEEVIVSFSRDLTQELEAKQELSLQREQLFQTEKMSALGGLLAGVAHELNNPLSVVVGHALMLSEEAKEPEVLRQTEKIRDAAERCAKIVKSFLTIARQQPANRAATDINAAVEIAVDLASFGNGVSGAAIEMELDPDLPQISADTDQITQVLVNLILNAEQAARDVSGGRVIIRSRPTPDGGVRIMVEDNGSGVPMDVRARVFEPFFTTKGIGEGTGIGLAYAHRVITAHDGQINIDANFRDGARFVVDLPPGGASSPEIIAPVTTKAITEAKRVMVIDDEPDVADLNAEVLERSGYAVTVAYSAAKAIETMRETRFDAVVSDLNMSGIDGRGFFEVVQRDFPELLPHTGFVTGDTMGRSSQTFLTEVQRPFIEKPVAPGELRDFVSLLLQKEDSR